MSEERAVEAARRTLVGFEAGINVFDPAGMLNDALTMARYLALSGAEDAPNPAVERPQDIVDMLDVLGVSDAATMPEYTVELAEKASAEIKRLRAVERRASAMSETYGGYRLDDLKAIYADGMPDNAMKADWEKLKDAAVDALPYLIEAVERPVEPTSDAQKAAMAWLDYCEAPSHARTIKAMLKRPADPRGWREALEALKAARQFIVNGTEFGYIRIPLTDPAHKTLPMIDAALAALSPAPKDREKD